MSAVSKYISGRGKTIRPPIAGNPARKPQAKPSAKIVHASKAENTKKDDEPLRPLQIKPARIQPRTLECVSVLVTTNEIQDGRFEKFMNRLLETNLENASGLVFYVIVNNGKEFQSLKRYNPQILSKFKSYLIFDVNISPADDVYITQASPEVDVPKYGLISGPNLLFFKFAELTKQYNTTLLLETDCILDKEWINKLSNYTQYVGPFLISGATYDGMNFTDDIPMMNHLNGVALYATSDATFHSLIEELKLFIESYKETTPVLAYDYAMFVMMYNGLKNTDVSHIWRFIRRYSLVCPFILNYSTHVNTCISVSDVENLQPFAVLHKKTND